MVWVATSAKVNVLSAIMQVVNLEMYAKENSRRETLLVINRCKPKMPVVAAAYCSGQFFKILNLLVGIRASQLQSGNYLSPGQIGSRW